MTISVKYDKSATKDVKKVIQTTSTKQTWATYLTTADSATCPATECFLYPYSNSNCGSDKLTSLDYLALDTKANNFKILAR